MWNKKTTPKILRKFFTGLEVLVVVAILTAGATGFSSWKNKNELKQAAGKNAEQAVVIDKLVTKIEEVNKQKDMVVVELQQVEEEIKEKVKTQFSVLYEQAVDIDDEQSSTFTRAHKETAKGYVKLWGYDAMAKIIKWQQEQIDAQMNETRRLLEEKHKLKAEYLEYKASTEKVIGETKLKAETHRMDAESLKAKVSDYLSQNSWLNQLVSWLLIGTGIYLFVTFGGIPLFFAMKNKAIKQVQEELLKEKNKKKDAMKTIRAFKAANDDGNDTMNRILSSMKIDAEKDDD
jgi:cellobiose-specific phosphotransferase system component IIA